ncbi:MAG: tRNA (5-methylaminomethyl-2-thiouridine)(34)-methyltransferase MnmD [Bacteroidales bacterium]|nr:tRNA (5-methylaminomethyl-2-thiouridine)(34)-methyltransferase MnmD [Bacteroidales bacterium]
MNQNTIIKTEDGSYTLYSQIFDEHYHSVNGAFTESTHIFIKEGLQYISPKFSNLNIFEMGFGTGLNAALSYIWSNSNKQKCSYYSVEYYPIETSSLKSNDDFLFNALTQVNNASWGNDSILSDYFNLTKYKIDIKSFEHSEFYHLVFWDAFSPDTQPELWTEELFSKIFDYLIPGGILVTYSVKGTVKRALKSVGFKIEKLAGPPGKREILRAIKPY